MKKTFREIQQLLYKNQELLKERVPIQNLKKLSKEYSNRGHQPPEYVMRKDLRYLKECLNG
jgi:hypothetical protein